MIALYSYSAGVEYPTEILKHGTKKNTDHVGAVL